MTSPALEAQAPLVEPAARPQQAVKAVAENPEPKNPEPVAATQGSPPSEPSQGQGKGKLIIVIASIGAVLLLAAAAAMVVLSSDKKKVAQEEPSAGLSLSPEERKDNAYRTRGWIEEAETVLQGFLEAETIEERAKWTIRGTSNEAEMASVYSKFEEDGFRTPVSIFSPVALSDSDTKRGIFLMTYNRPEQFTIRNFFRPIPPLRVRYGIEEPDQWLVSEAAVNNFVDRPLKVMAFFAKTPEGLKLDWQTYGQTKFRLLDQFVNNPEAGARGIFRVFVQEDVDLDGRDKEGFSVFRFSDPANSSDYAKVLVKDDSELGRAMASLKWRDRIVVKAPVRNATVSLVWSNDPKPSLQMGELICWEFLDLGGERGNWKENASE